MRTSRSAISGFSLVCFFLSGSIAAAQAPASHMYCFGQTVGPPGTHYYSSSFEVIPGGFVEGRRSFLTYLQQKYDFKGLVSCTSPRTLDVARAELKKVADDAQRGMNVKLETGWVFAGAGAPPAAPPAPPAAAPPPSAPSPSTAPSAPAPAPPARPAPPPPAPSPTASVKATTHAVCWADFDPGTRYYSAVFDGTKGDYAQWMPGFKAFLNQEYRYTGQVRCTKKPNKAEAQQYWDDMVTAARGLTLAGGVKPRIIETGWAYD